MARARGETAISGPAPVTVDRLLGAIESGASAPVYLISGDLVVGEAASRRVAAALAGEGGSAPVVTRRPPDLALLVDDLKTFSLFGGGKVVVAIDSAVVADKATAGELVRQALDAVPLRSAAGLSGSEREGASRLLQALHLFGIEAEDVETALGELPGWAFSGAKGRRVAKAKVEAGREKLRPLLERAREAGLQGVGQSGLGQVADAARRGLPEGHHLVLVERSVAADHPLVRLLDERGARLDVARVASDRRGWHGIEALVAEVADETGAEVRRDAVAELVRRTLRHEGREAEASADSTARFAGELRKLANLADGAPVTAEMVRSTVEDRGEEDVWKLLDEIAAGHRRESLVRLRRLLDGAADPVRERLAFFSLLSGFCRQMVAVRGAVDAHGVPSSERSYPRFKSSVAPALTQPIIDGATSPLAKVHPFRLHRAYLAAGRFDGRELERLPFRLLEAEVALKGGSGEGEAALVDLVSHLADASV